MSFADHLQRAAGLVDEAAQHHHAAVLAHKRGDDEALGDAHIKLGRCLRSAQQAFRDMAAAASEQDLINSKTIQTSSGVGVSGGSDNGRGSPLMLKGNAGIKNWLDRARVGARR
jgi:hypothetical protein